MLELIYTIGEVAGLIALLFTSVLYIRIFMVISSLIYVACGFMLNLYSMSIWSSVYIIVNLVQIFIIIQLRYPIFLPKQLSNIYKKSFQTMTTREFKKIFNFAKKESFNPGNIIEDNQPVKMLRVILSGNAEVYKAKQKLATLSPGQFIGEMSFIAERNATATVSNTTNLTCQTWSHEDLEKLQSKHPNLYTKLITIIGKDIVLKLHPETA